MAEIVTSLIPGHYPAAKQLTITFPGNARKAIITNGTQPPTITDVIAYDDGPITPVPPSSTNPGPTVKRPFLTVTQDGKGNVVYDGGFPKFYNRMLRVNNVWPASLPNQREQLPPAAQYLINELQFIANPKKVNLGNRKVLFVNNTYRTESYNIKGSYYAPAEGQPAGSKYTDDSFRDTLDAVCNIGGWVPTYYDCTDAGGPINLSTSYLDSFVAVVVFATYAVPNKAGSRFTEYFASNMAQFRRFGNGVAIITDHCGANYTSIKDALDRGTAFGADGTKIAQYYGVYFSGNIDRSPMSVGSIKAQLGTDHQLFAGMADSDYIYAGGSESMAIPETDNQNEVPANKSYVVNMDTAGVYRYNILVQMNDGSIITRNVRYVVLQGSDINMIDTLNRGPGAEGLVTYKEALDYSILVSGITESLFGQILIDNRPVGWFSTALADNSWVTSYAPLTGADTPILIKTGQVLSFQVSDPFEYIISAPIKLTSTDGYYASTNSISGLVNKLITDAFYSGNSYIRVTDDVAKYATRFYPAAKPYGVSAPGQWWKIAAKARTVFNPVQTMYPAKMKIYKDLATWNNTKPISGSVGDAVIIASDNSVYYWNDSDATWLLNTGKAQVLFGVGRLVVNLFDLTEWVIKSGTTVPKT